MCFYELSARSNGISKGAAIWAAAVASKVKVCMVSQYEYLLSKMNNCFVFLCNFVDESLLLMKNIEQLQNWNIYSTGQKVR